MWVANTPLRRTRNMTLDGETYQIENAQLLLGTYYFYHTVKTEHIRIVMSWFAVGAEVGGLAEILFILLGPIALWYN